MIRNITIKGKIIEYQDARGPWKPFTDKQNQQENVVASSSALETHVVTGTENQQLLPLSELVAASSSLECKHEIPVIEPVEELHEVTHFRPKLVEVLTGNDLSADTFAETNIRFKPVTETEYEIPPLTMLYESNDPALYVNKRITPSIISLLINSSCQPNKNDTMMKTKGRSFISDWFRVAQPDKTWKTRAWLSYSTSTNSAFCTTCLLFGGPTSDSIWTQLGYKGWQSGHGLRDIERHEASSQHRQTEVIRFQWIHENRVDQPLAVANKLIVEQNRRVMYIAVKAMKFLATEMMAVLGHSNRDGKFLHLFREFSELDPCAAAYLRQLDDIRHRDVRSKPEVNLLSPLNCRRCLQTMKNLVVREICSQISQQKAFAIINDGTQDLSKKDAQAVLVRYISTINGNLRPVERLIEVFTTGDSTGQGLCDRIVPILRELKLQFEWIIGQSYDGASNMSGKYSGLQAKLRELSKKALYIWCQAHRLNLLIEGVLKSSPQVTGTISLLQELYNFFNGFTRNAVLTAAQENERYVQTLKRVSETTRSWRSAEDGVNVVVDRYESIINALEDLSTASNHDATTASSADGLLRRLQDFDIIVTLFMLRTIFKKTGPVSRLLQGVACDYGVAASLLHDCVNKINKMRDNADTYWKKLIAEAKQFATKHEIVPIFPVKRQKRTKLMPGEVVRDERIQDPEQAFKVNTYIPALESVQSEFRERFTDMTIDVLSEMQHFTPKFLLSNQPDITGATIGHLCNFYEMDATDVALELAEFRPVFRTLYTLISVDDLMSSDARSMQKAHSDSEYNDKEDDLDVQDDAESQLNKLQRWAEQGFVKPLRALQELSGFPSLNVMYKILVSLAITSSSAERAMSRVRLIKNRLRTTMLDDWFSSMMVLASEKDILDNIPVDRIIDHFATLSRSLQKLLID